MIYIGVFSTPLPQWYRRHHHSKESPKSKQNHQNVKHHHLHNHQNQSEITKDGKMDLKPLFQTNPNPTLIWIKIKSHILKWIWFCF